LKRVYNTFILSLLISYVEIRGATVRTAGEAQSAWQAFFRGTFLKRVNSSPVPEYAPDLHSGFNRGHTKSCLKPTLQKSLFFTRLSFHKKVYNCPGFLLDFSALYRRQRYDVTVEVGMTIL